MELFEALLGRRTIYRYRDQAVPREAIERAVDAARWAPNHKLTEPWRFLLLGPETRALIADVAARLARAKSVAPGEGRALRTEEAVRARITGAPALLAVTSLRSVADPFREREDYAATCCALHNFVLALWSEGIGCQWSTGSVTRDPDTYERLGVDREEHEIIGFLRAGYPETVPEQRRQEVSAILATYP